METPMVKVTMQVDYPPSSCDENNDAYECCFLSSAPIVLTLYFACNLLRYI